VDNRVVFSVVNDTSADIGASFSKTNGVGLANIRQRLSLLYGETGALNIEQTHEWVTATLSLPLERQS
jgi:LytS/YehU family sensor histidine kinase